MALSITTANYQEIIDSGKPVVIDFWAEWCGPCRMVGPIIDELAAEYDGKVVIGKCDVDENDALAVKFGVRKGGEVVDKQIGAGPKSVFEEKIAKLL